MIDELEGEFFTIADIDQEWMYKTILYGWLYDFDNVKDDYYLLTLVTDESDGTIYFHNIYEDMYDNDEFQKPDQRYYSRADREIIVRTFDYEWER